MADSAMNERNVILSEQAGDPRRVQAVLADWGLDEVSINRMLSEHTMTEALRDNTSANASSGNPRSHDAAANSRRGTGLHA